MTVPYYVNEHTSDIRAIKPGWYAMETNGQLSSGPFFSHEECFSRISQARSNLAPALARTLEGGPACRTPIEGGAP
jgi:hypothetical protein